MFERLMQVIYPPKCLLCREILEDGEEVLCGGCYERFQNEIKPFVIQSSCSALFPYTGEFRQSILRWKYGGTRKYARSYAKLIVEDTCILNNTSVEAMVPIPLSPNRLRKRGFNQALDLALEIERLTTIPVWDCLERVRSTKPQAECSKDERIRNIKGTIRVKRDFLESIVQNRVNHLLLVDDIYTTGSTVDECINILKQEYLLREAKIDSLVIGRGHFYELNKD